MTGFRVTKFNPHFRLESGAYANAEWTSISDLGRNFSGQTFTLAEYLKVEDAYVKSVRSFLAAADVTKLQIKAAEVHEGGDILPDSLRAETKAQLSLLTKEREVSGQQIDWVVRLNLRECFWCRLQGEKGVYVHFGWDYYMYLGIEDDNFRLPQIPNGIFVEPFASPHTPE